MKSIRVDYDEGTGKIEIAEGAAEQGWAEVCETFNDDVHRVKAVEDQDGYTALYECYDDDNRKSHFLVEEDRSLYKRRHYHMRRNLGLDP